MSAAANVEVRLLGPFEITAGGGVLEISGAKQRLLLAMLAVRRHRPVSLDALAEEVWGEHPPASVAAAIQTLVYRLRRMLAAAGVTSDLVLRASGTGYLLEVDDDRVDAHRFEDLTTQAREALRVGDPDAASGFFRQALSLWRGPALDGMADRDFARIEADRLNEVRLESLEDLADAELGAGRPLAAVTLLEPHVAEYPLREQAWGRLMLGLYRLGRQAEALRAYQAVRRLLGEELGLEPTPALRRLEQQILEQSPELEQPVAIAPPPVARADTFALAGDQLPAGVTLLDLGEHRLPDLTRPERLYQVSHPELPSDLLAARSPDAPQDNLPMALTSFVGRQRELEELEKLLATSRLLTLTGVGGAGKTRLALRLAGEVRDLFPDGVWLVELGSISDPSLVASEMMEALGILVSGLGLEGTAPEVRLCDYLRPRTVLLVLDTCEHVIGPVGHLVQTILASCPGVTVLATSREVLGLAGEVPWALPGLTLPPLYAGRPDDLVDSDAVALFCTRAAGARPGFGLTAANAEAVASICRRLDGIPLALELAATRIRVLGAHQVAERLDDRFRLLCAGGATTVSRHQTLRATMDWSYQLLPAAEQALLRRLAVFPQSFDLEAVEGVWDGGGDLDVDALDLLARLVDKSLVVVESTGTDVRYRLLDTVREYGSEKLAEAGEAQAAHRRHRDFFLQVALDRFHHGSKGVGTFWDADWMLRVDDDRESLHAALDWSLTTGDPWRALVLGVALWPYWLFWKGFLGTPYDRLERALSAGEPVLDAFRVDALLGLRIAIIEMGEGDPQQADALLQEAHRVALSLDDPVTEARSRFYLGQTAHSRGDVEEGRRQLELSLAGYETAGYPWGVAWGNHELGWAALAAGEVHEARFRFERALEEQPEGHEMLRAHALAALATVVALAGEADLAEAMSAEAVVVARGIRLRQILVVALVRAGEVAVLTGRPGRARAVLIEVLGILSDLGARRWVADTLEATALVLEAHGRTEATARLLGTSDALRVALHEPQIGLPAMAARLATCRHQVEAALGADAVASAELRPDRVEEVLELARSELSALTT